MTIEVPKFDPAFTMPITKDVSQTIAEHYGYKCQLSGRDVSAGNFHVDHVFPRALGGPDNLQNYVIADASANIGKNANRLAPDLEASLLQSAKVAAPILWRTLMDVRGSDGRAISPIVVHALRQLSLTPGSRVATGAYVRSQEEPAPGIKWWAYWGPDRSAGVTYDILQFGVKLLRADVAVMDRLRSHKKVRERGGNTFYIPVEAKLPRTIDIHALKAAQSAIGSLIGWSQ